MSGVKHTPGRWTAHKTIEAHDGMPECWQIDAEHDAVCTTQFCYAPNTEANARLIAAAPDLLDALIEARLTLSLTRTNIMVEMKKSEGAAYRWEGVPELLANRIAQCDAAIARARGES